MVRKIISKTGLLTSRYPHRVLSAVILAAAVILSSALVLPLLGQDPRQTTSMSSLANCEAAEFRCYAEYFAALTYDKEPQEAFKVLKDRYKTDSYVKSECHQMVHIIGRTAYKKYGTLAAAYPKGDSFCWSGYHHGVTEQAISDIGADKIKQQANDICASLSAKQRYSFDHYNCVHGLGHGFMAVDDYELFRALKTCDSLKDGWDRASCYGGVYMENVMVAARGNGTSKYLKADDPLYPCNAVEASYKEQCYLMQSSYVLQKNGYDFGAAFGLCATADEGFQNTCYQSIGRDASGSTVSDVARTKTNCDHAQDDNAKQYCMVGAAKDFISYYHDDTQAKELCKAFGGTIQISCESTVKDYYRIF